MSKQQTSDLTLAEILQNLEDRIQTLALVKVALQVVLGDAVIEQAPEEEPTLEERQHASTPPRAKRAKAKARVKFGNKLAILAALADGPLSPDEVFKRMKKSGWTTSSVNPRSLVGTTLGSMAAAGKLRRIGGDYALPAPQQTTEVAAELEA